MNEDGIEYITKELKSLVIEVASPPTRSDKPINILDSREFIKLVQLLKKNNESWMVLKFSKQIYLLWKDKIFVYELL